ncbi:MAG: type IV secretion system DNA-binding domain-containing protein [Candidatus Azambacteria bacterium]|nr:type IV secretion system DNA-binding domain-containing protein [Candidatus Azambacteria bacterium]
MKDEITFFAETNFRNQRKRFGIKIDDRRRHMYIIGQTGTGKTTLLMNMLVSDIVAGRGVGFIDPHGDMAEHLLNYIPKERIEDVIYFNPADMAYPIAFNAIEKVDPEVKHLVASGLMGVFKKIWPDVWSARMEYILNNTVLSLLEIPGSTLLGINRMFSDKAFRKSVVDQLDDPVIKAFWTQEYAKYQQRYEQEATAAIQNKIGQFSSAAVIRNIIGQPHSSFDFRKAMDERKIIIMNLSKGRVGEDNSKLLGGMLITKIQLAAMSRVDIPEEERKDFYLYVDEFQNFVTDSFATILSEARKYRLDLIITNQYIGQLVHDQNTRVKDAIFGNVGTFIAFRTGGEDVEFLEEKQFGPNIVAQDLLNLPNYNIYLRLMIDGVPSRPFSAITLPPILKPEISYADEIIEHSRKSYGTPRAEVEKAIAIATGVEETPSGDKPSFTESAQQPADNLESRAMFDAVCVSCKKEIKVPFKPDPTRPVYCKDCFAEMKQKPSKVSLSQLKPRAAEDKPSYAKATEGKKQRKSVDLEGLKKILEETFPKK